MGRRRRQPGPERPHPARGESPSSLRPGSCRSQIARSHNCSVSSVVLSWLTQEGVVAIPRSSQPGHIAENAAMLGSRGFLSDEEMERIRALDGMGPER